MLRNVWDVFEPSCSDILLQSEYHSVPFFVKHITIAAKIRLLTKKNFDLMYKYAIYIILIFISSYVIKQHSVASFMTSLKF